jgi:hypothetical protein
MNSSRIELLWLVWDQSRSKYYLRTKFQDGIDKPQKCRKVCYHPMHKEDCNGPGTFDRNKKFSSASEVVRDSSVVRRHYILLLEPSNVRAQYIRKTADLLLQLWVSTFPRFVAIRFYFLSETRFTNHFSIHS